MSTSSGDRKEIDLAASTSAASPGSKGWTARSLEGLKLPGIFFPRRTMNIRVDIDVENVVKLTATVLRQLPYAANNAFTRTAKEMVEAGRKEISADLQVRK